MKKCAKKGAKTANKKEQTIPDCSLMESSECLQSTWESKLKSIRTKGSCRLKTKRTYPLVEKSACLSRMEVSPPLEMDAGPLPRVKGDSLYGVIKNLLAVSHVGQFSNVETLMIAPPLRLSYRVHS